LPAGAVPPDYPYWRADEPALGAPYDEPCWSYDCESAPGVAPYPKRAVRRAPLLLRRLEGDGNAHVLGSTHPWVRGHGKLRLVVAVAYADAPMPDDAIATLFAPAGAADGSSLAAVAPWFAAQSKALGLPAGVEIELVWSGKQVKVPDEQVPVGYDACTSADWKELLAPALAPVPGLTPDDILVQLYWGRVGDACASHVLRQTRSYLLFARPDFFSPPGLVVSAAHELMHLFGASDKYTTTAEPDAQGKPHGCFFEGPDYDARDIMCHRVLSPSGGFENPPLPELVVAPLTAREVGWVDIDGDGALEVDDACPSDVSCR
jgi:hypothetical protein